MSIVNSKTLQISSQRSPSGSNFPSGNLNFKFSVGSGDVWVPRKSYFRMRATLTRGDDTALETADGAGANMNLMGNLFSAVETKINGVVVGRLSENLDAVSALNTRLNKSASWINSVGNISNKWGTLEARIADVSKDGFVSGGNNEYVDEGRLSLGFATGTTIAFTLATRILTFATGTIPDVREIFPVGSIIKLGATYGTLIGANSELKVLSHTSATVLGVSSGGLNADVAAAVVDFSRRTYARKSLRASNLELIWTPSNSLFNIVKDIEGECDIDIQLTPKTSSLYQQSAFQTTLTAGNVASGSTASTLKFNVVDLYLYVNILKTLSVGSSYRLPLNQIQAQTTQVLSASFSQYQFSISPSTTAITIALQDGRINDNSVCSASQLKSYNAGLTATTDLNLNRFYLQYASQVIPSIDAEPSYIANDNTAASVVLGTEYTTQQYLESQLNSGAYFQNGGCETLEEFKERGAFYHFVIPRERDSSDRLTVNMGFISGTDVTNMKVVVFAHSAQVADITMDNGRVSSVMLSDK